MAINYAKQTWSDGTSGQTYPSPSRLNHMEDGIKASCDAWDSVSPTVLWSGRTNTSFALSDSCANYARIAVRYVDNDGNYGSAEIDDPDGKQLCLMTASALPDAMFVKTGSLLFSGRNVDYNKFGEMAANGSGKVSSRSIFVLVVHGYRIK